jgi:hypothetical protein
VIAVTRRSIWAGSWYFSQKVVTVQGTPSPRLRRPKEGMAQVLPSGYKVGLALRVSRYNVVANIDQLGSYVGLIPRIRESGETIHTGGITFRCNSFLRTLLIESSWQAIRMDPALMQYYHSHLINNKGHKVVIKVARKLLNRIRYVMKNRKPYITGVV